MSENIFAVARKLLETMKNAKDPLCNWRDDDERLEFLKTRRHRTRNEILDLLVPQRKCPWCEQLKLGSRQWVVFSMKNLPEVTEENASRLTRVLEASKEGACCMCRSCVILNAPKAWGAGASAGLRIWYDTYNRR